MRVNEVLKFYQSERSDIADKNRLDIAVVNLNGYFANTEISDIGVMTCRHYQDYRKKSKVKRFGDYYSVSDATIARELGVLKAAAKNAVKWKKINSSDMPVIEIPDNLPKREAWLLKNEVQYLFDLSKNNQLLNIFVKLLYFTASRRKAIEQLKWSQIDFINKRISLKKPGEQETIKRRPTVPMGALFPEIKQLYATKKNDWVLESNTNRYRQFIQLLEKTGLLYVSECNGRPAGRITPHSLRHSRATHLLEAGMSIYKVAQLLGDNPLTVQRVYAHACISDLDEDLRRYG